MSQAVLQPVILMYHGIVSEWTALPKERDAGAGLYDVPTVSFLEQMEWLQANNYRVGTFEEDGHYSDEQKVILTFDDGEMNNYDQALPVLKKCGFPAYFFIIAKRVGEYGYMSWDELRAIHESGMIIGSHGFSHEILTNLMDSQVEEELRASKRYLERNLDITVDTFSMPRGFCNNKVVRMAYEAGYKHVLISDRPRELTEPCLSRVSVKATWPIKRFNQAIIGNIPVRERIFNKGKNVVKRVFGEGAYDWLRRTLIEI